MKRTDVASNVIAAPSRAIYQAFLDPAAVATWRPPKGMSAVIHEFDPREGGAYRMALVYADAGHAVRGKTSEHADVFTGRFLELVPDERIVELVEFESDDPAFADAMTIVTTMTAVPAPARRAPCPAGRVAVCCRRPGTGPSIVTVPALHTRQYCQRNRSYTMRTWFASVVAGCLVICAGDTLTAQSQFVWHRFGNLNIGRSIFNVLPIGNAKALVLGGYSSAAYDPNGEEYGTEGEPERSCEVIDVRTRTVDIVNSMNVAHAEAVAMMLPDSNVLMISGVTSRMKDLTKVCEIRDRVTGAWRVVGNLLAARRQHGACVINDHEVLVLGGRDAARGGLHSAEIFNFKTGVSRYIEDFPFYTTYPIVYRAPNGDILAFSGRSGGGNSSRRREIYRYDSTLDVWRLFGTIADGVHSQEALTLRDGSLLLSGGNTAEIPMSFSTALQQIVGGKVQQMQSLLLGRVWHAMAQIDADRAIVIGGWTSPERATKKCEMVAIESGGVMPGPNLLEARRWHRAVSVEVPNEFETADMVVLAISGIDAGTNTLRSIEVLEPDCLPAPKIVVGGQLTFCQGASVRLSAPSGYSSYRWSNGATTQAINVVFSGRYTVTTESGTPCEQVSAGIDVVVLPAPQEPTIEQRDGALFSSIALSYQWMVNNIPIPGAVAQRYTPTLPGSYSVVITDSNGCSSISKPFVFISVSVADARAGDGIAVFPNPARTVLNVGAELPLAVPVGLELVDASGRRLASIDEGIRGGAYRRELSLEGMPAGMLILRLHVGDRVVERTVVKE